MAALLYIVIYRFSQPLYWNTIFEQTCGRIQDFFIISVQKIKILIDFGISVVFIIARIKLYGLYCDCENNKHNSFLQ
jgi:hypothetical protein